MKVVTDASPLNYLVLINAEHVLPRLFGEVLVPAAVIEELTHVRTPAKVREWVSAPPTWLRVTTTAGGFPDERLGPGESAAIAIAIDVAADALLIDERDGTGVARRLGIKTVGTLATLGMAAEKGAVNLEEAFHALRSTSFRATPSLLDALLTLDRQRGEQPRS
jgi:predicted nucleic acid-binding protein